MKVHDDVDVGAATHTGCVRSSNEDDYLVLMPHDTELLGAGRLLALADGMGGAAGGAEASRAAIRAASQSFLQPGSGGGDPKGRMQEGFERACARVFEISRQSPSLRGMGTTLTILNFSGDRAILGHVGDSRCYRLRGGELEQLTEDHAVSGQENRLTRCIGGGRPEERADVTELEVRRGDCFLLATDGLWDFVPQPEIQRLMADSSAQAAADELVWLANENGGPDNSTAVVLRVLRTDGAPGSLGDVDLPSEEARVVSARLGSARRLRPPRWPWVIVLVSIVLGGLAVARLQGVDVVELVVDSLR